MLLCLQKVYCIRLSIATAQVIPSIPPPWRHCAESIWLHSLFVTNTFQFPWQSSWVPWREQIEDLKKGWIPEFVARNWLEDTAPSATVGGSLFTDSKRWQGLKLRRRQKRVNCKQRHVMNRQVKYCSLPTVFISFPFEISFNQIL
jgi:hypothetical protein